MKECPFCGSTDVQISNNDRIEYYGKCNNCLSFSEEALSREEAFSNWERRSNGEGERLSKNEKLILSGLVASSIQGLEDDEIKMLLKSALKKLK